jgi:hypothetical protein
MAQPELPTREDMLAALQEGAGAAIALFEAQNAIIRPQQEIIEQLLARLQALEDQTATPGPALRLRCLKS